MTAIVSLIKLLEIGRLGPLHAGVSLRDAAALLGPPVSCTERCEPLHGKVWVWHYGELELVFGIVTPWPLLFFAVADLPAAGKATLIVDSSQGPAMVIDLDGIDQAMRPTGALALVRRRGEPSQILYWPLGRDDAGAVAVDHCGGRRRGFVQGVGRRDWRQRGTGQADRRRAVART